MAALNRPTKATYAIHENVTVDTTDNEDHTFCGIMFPIKCKDILPVNHIVMNSLSVRGGLGPLTVWVTNDPNAQPPETDVASSQLMHHQTTNSAGSGMTNAAASSMTRQQARRNTARVGNPQNGEIIMSKKHWTKIYEKTHPPSFRKYAELDLSANPVILKPGQVRAIYIHSTLPGDEAIVYDNKQKEKTHDDGFITILPGRAHVSERPFGTRPIWGWGNPWRDNREFVGRVSYGAVYKLWNPKKHLSFGDNFQALTRTLFMCQRRWESPLSRLPDDCIFYILNMCRWDWANDTVENLRINKKRTVKRLRQQQEAAEQNAGESNDVSTEEVLEDSMVDQDQIMETSEEDENWGDDDEDDDPEYDENYDEDSDNPEWMEDEEDSTEAAVFHYRDYDSDDSDARNEEEQLREQESRRVSLGRLFPQLHILQALVNLNETGVMEIIDNDETA